MVTSFHARARVFLPPLLREASLPSSTSCLPLAYLISRVRRAQAPGIKYHSVDSTLVLSFYLALLPPSLGLPSVSSSSARRRRQEEGKPKEARSKMPTMQRWSSFVAAEISSRLFCLLHSREISPFVDEISATRRASDSRRGFYRARNCAAANEGIGWKLRRSKGRPGSHYTLRYAIILSETSSPRARLEDAALKFARSVRRATRLRRCAAKRDPFVTRGDLLISPEPFPRLTRSS